MESESDNMIASILKYDVVVVGAGPAGSTAAKWAARSGARVLLIEKRQEIGAPVRCGEEIRASWLPSVGISADKKWIDNEVHSMRVFAPNGDSVRLGERIIGKRYAINRTAFDMALAEDAIRAGADVMVKTSATGLAIENAAVVGIRAHCMGESFEVRAGVVIGADGFESKVGRWAGIDTSLAKCDINPCFEYTLAGVECDVDCVDVFFGSTAPGGYAWIFPKGEGIANVGLGLQLSKIRERGAVKAYLDKFISEKPALSKGRPVRAISGAVSLSMPLEKTVMAGLMLVGDSARQIDPTTGEGVENACVAGMLAGRVAGKAVARCDFSCETLMEYDRAWRARFGKKMRSGYIAKQKVANLSDELINKCVSLGKIIDLEQLSIPKVLWLAGTRYPELVREFGISFMASQLRERSVRAIKGAMHRKYRNT